MFALKSSVLITPGAIVYFSQHFCYYLEFTAIKNPYLPKKFLYKERQWYYFEDFVQVHRTDIVVVVITYKNPRYNIEENIPRILIRRTKSPQEIITDIKYYTRGRMKAFYIRQTNKLLKT